MERHGREVAIEVLDLVPFYEADEAESRHIRRCRAIGCDLTNRTDGGRGRRGWVISADTRARMRASASNRKVSAETRQKMSASIRASEAHRRHLQRLHQMNRKPCQLSTRLKISEALRGENNKQSVLTWEGVAKIRELYEGGTKQAELCRMFECAPATIHNVVKGKTWIAV